MSFLPNQAAAAVVLREAILACYRSGQMSAAQWERHCEDDPELRTMVEAPCAMTDPIAAMSRIADFLKDYDFQPRQTSPGQSTAQSAIVAMHAECDEAREKLGECHAGYETLRKELAAAREALEHAERFFRRILVAYDNPIPVDAKSSLWSDPADYMAKCARAGEERTRAALGKRGEE